MAGSSGGSMDFDSQSDESYQFERPRIEPHFSSFVCPLTNKVMRDPVIIENGNTFEREAIEKWFRECEASGRRPTCPKTKQELRSTHLNPSIALRNTIEEWTARKEAAHLDMARRWLSVGTSEKDILQALKYVVFSSKGSRSNKHAVHNAEIVQLIVDMLRNGSRKVRSKALETLQVIAEQDSDMKEIMAEGRTVRTIVKFLSPEQSTEREQAISLLYELSKSQNLSDKIGSINGAILMLVGVASSKSERSEAVEKADKTLNNLAQCENNVRLMAESGRLEPLLKLLLEGPPETKISMAEVLGDLALNNDVKVHVAQTVGSSLVSLMRNGDIRSREASLKALNQISSYDTSAKVLIEVGILPPLVKDLFTANAKQLPMRLKEVSATILSNVVNSGSDIGSVVIGPKNETLVSESTLHSLLHLISNTGPSIECKLLQVLVGLTSYRTTVLDVVEAIKSSGATISLVQFIEASQRDLRLAAVKLLHNLSPYMAEELAEALLGSAGQLGSLLRIISENVITEEQAAAVGLLAELPENDLALTQQMVSEAAHLLLISKVKRVRQGETRGSRFVTPYQEGLVRSLARFTYVVGQDPEILSLCRELDLGELFIDLLQVNGLDNVQIASAWALHNLSLQSIKLTRKVEVPTPGFWASLFGCFSKQPDMVGVCPVHGGLCSLKETFCLVEGHAAVDKLVALLDHTNERVVEASLEALSTLLEDGVNIEEGVMILHKAEGTKPVFEILVENRTENLRKTAVWMVERLLRTDQIAYDVSNDQNVGTALVDAFQHGDYPIRQIAEKALKHVDRIPNFSGIFQNNG